MSLRPRFSTLVAAGLAVAGAVLLVAAMLLGQSGDSAGRTVVTVRLWDEQVADAYRTSFAEFGREHPDIEVRVSVVAYSTYFDTLRTDVAGGGADDIFWLSNAYFAEYADSARLMNIADTLGEDSFRAWEPSVVDQFTRNGALWAVPQLTDAGIAVYYNADLLDAAGVDADELGRCAGHQIPAPTRCGRCWRASHWTTRAARRTHRVSTRSVSGSGVTTPPTIYRTSTSTTSVRRAGSFRSATGLRSTTRRPRKRSSTWWV